MSSVDFQISGMTHSRSVTVAQALVNGTGLLSRLGMESARLDTELLLGTALGCEREQLYVNYERRLDPADQTRFLTFLQRRTRWEPMAYIIGHREFWSLEFTLTPAVLVPRPETELLVEETLRQLEKLERDIGPSGPKSNFRILDLGTGCGAIAVSLAKERNDVEIWATDLSSAALEVAQSNAQQHGVRERIRFIHGELFEPLENRMGFFHGIVSNPPLCESEGNGKSTPGGPMGTQACVGSRTRRTRSLPADHPPWAPLSQRPRFYGPGDGA